MQFSLRTLLVVLAVAPAVLAALWTDWSMPLAVAGWLALLFFFLHVSLTDARQHSRIRDQ
jgi:hypothetical protein